MARPVAHLFGQAGQVGGGRGPRDGQRGLEAGEVPGLRRRHQRQTALAAGHAQIRHEVHAAGDERGVDLVGDDAYAMAAGEGGDGGQFVGGVHGAGRVVRAAQQVGGAPAVRRRPPEGVLQDAEVDTEAGAERGFQHPPVHVLHELVERRIDGRVHHDRIARPGDQLEHLDHTEHHVGHDRRPLHGEPLPAPPFAREVGERLGVGRAGGVTGVAEGEGVGDRADDGFGERYVHLGHPQRQDVLGVGAPLHARTTSKSVEGECAQGIRFTGRFVRDPGHGAQDRGLCGARECRCRCAGGRCSTGVGHLAREDRRCGEHGRAGPRMQRGCSTPGGPRGVRTALYWFGSHA